MVTHPASSLVQIGKVRRPRPVFKKYAAMQRNVEKDTFYCNAAIAVHLVKKELVSNVKYYSSFGVQVVSVIHNYKVS